MPLNFYTAQTDNNPEHKIKPDFGNRLGNREYCFRYPGQVRLSWVSVGFSYLFSFDTNWQIGKFDYTQSSNKKFGEKDSVTNCEPTILRILKSRRSEILPVQLLQDQLEENWWQGDDGIFFKCNLTKFF